MNDARFIEIIQAARQHGKAAAESRKGMEKPDLEGDNKRQLLHFLLQHEIGATDDEWREIGEDACGFWLATVEAVWKAEA